MLLGIAGVTALIYGGFHLYKVSGQDATNDGVIGLLGQFVNCKDDVNAVQHGDYDVGAVQHFVKHKCQANQAPAKIAMGFAATFIILTLLCAPCAFKKNEWFGFGVWSSLAIACTLLAAVVVASQALPVASQFVDCHKMDANTINFIQGAPYNAICIKGPDGSAALTKHSALKWLCKMCTFFGGAVTSVIAILFMMIIRKCKCCNSNAAAGQQQAQACHGPCPISSCCARLRSRMCSRNSHQPLANQADEGLPVSAPSYYDVNAPAPSDSPRASEDAGAYHSYSVQ